jgi:hypothetical protein
MDRGTCARSTLINFLKRERTQNKAQPAWEKKETREALTSDIRGGGHAHGLRRRLQRCSEKKGGSGHGEGSLKRHVGTCFVLNI